ncbi:peptidase domain-containing ABC transporter [Streptomyces sp. NPDC017529]|uniref:peptidase domain-containing ABC transporter n=1 Tax=Streptomyces sp. NPDC017529 TaxID=3365000 RepID=UPI0037BD5307
MKKFRRFHTSQTGDTDCGPACVRTVLRRHGKLIDVAVLSESVGLGRRGSSLLRLQHVLADYGIDSELFRLDIGQLAQAVHTAGPAIVRVQVMSQPHFVVVHAEHDGHFAISDPLLSAPTKMSADALAEIFTGHALVTDTPAAGLSLRSRLSELRSQRVVWPLVRSRWPALTAILALTALVSGASLLTSIFLQVAVDRVVRDASMHSINLLTATVAGILVLVGVAQYARGRLAVSLGQALQRQLSETYVRKLLRLPTAFHNNRRVGDLVSRLDDVQEIQALVSTSTVQASMDVGVVLGVGAYLALTNKYVLAVLLLSAAANVLTSRLLFSPIRTASEEALQRDATLKAELFNLVHHYEQVVSYAKRDFALGRIRERLERRISAETRLGRLGNLGSVVMTVNLGLTTVLTTWVCLRLALSGILTVGQIFASVSLAGYFLSSANSIAALQVTLQRLFAAVGRYREIINQNEDPRLAPAEPSTTETPLSAEPTHIEVGGLSVTYPTSSRPAVKELQLSIEPASTTLIVGANGQGKSTALKAIAGFFSEYHGTVTVNGRDSRQLRENELRDRVLYLSDSPLLITATLRENLTLGRPAEDEAIELACKIACFDEVIRDLPGGLSWGVREDGSGLSRGQMQRLALARAVLHAPDVYLLDEAFSGIDRGTVHRIWSNLASLPASKVVVSHTDAADLTFDHIVQIGSPAQNSIVMEGAGNALR